MTNKTFFSVLTLSIVILMNCNTAVANTQQKNWLDRFLIAAPMAMCNQVLAKPTLKQKLARQNIDKNGCIISFKNMLNRCITRYKSKLPASFDQNFGRIWGSMLGSCAAIPFYDRYLATTYTPKTFAKRLMAVPIIPRFCSSPYMQATFAAKKSTAAQCIAKLNPYRQQCTNFALKNQPATFKGVKIEKAIMQRYMQCLIKKSKLL